MVIRGDLRVALSVCATGVVRCRPYGAQVGPRTYPGLPSWALLFRADGAEERFDPRLYRGACALRGRPLLRSGAPNNERPSIHGKAPKFLPADCLYQLPSTSFQMPSTNYQRLTPDSCL